MRNLERHVSRASGYEFEDMICEELDSAQIIAPRPGRSRTSVLRRSLRNQAMMQFGHPSSFDVFNAGMGKAQLDADVDLFFFNPALPRDLAELSNVPNWRKRSRFAICWVQELWITSIAHQKRMLDILDQFDHVICSFHHTMEPLRKRLAVPVTYLPWGVDAELFCPHPNRPSRVIEVAGIGELPEATEKALIRHADDTGSFFHYQTVFGPAEAKSHKVHRHNYAGLLKRSEFFLCYLAKFMNNQRDRQIEFGLRYIEGVAAGTVLLGDPVDNPVFEKFLGWTDSVIPLDAASTEPETLIKALKAQPERISEARRNNVANALGKLDHLYRWQDILKIAGLSETPGMARRKSRLQALSNMVSQAAV